MFEFVCVSHTSTRTKHQSVMLHLKENNGAFENRETFYSSPFVPFFFSDCLAAVTFLAQLLVTLRNASPLHPADPSDPSDLAPGSL